MLSARGLEGTRSVRLAAIGDLHAHSDSRGHISPLFKTINRDADVLVLAGDLTLSGHFREAEVLVQELRGVDLPIVAVLGNHEYDLNHDADIAGLLREAGAFVLDGDSVTLEVNGMTVGFVGAKGFCGGFEKYMVAPFGEDSLKDFVHAGQMEAEKIEASLAALAADYRVVVLHYSPIRETLQGESPELFAFLGNSRLAKPIDQFGADIVFHAHAHYGSPSGHTKTGIPVYNVARTIVQQVLVRELRASERVVLAN